LGSMGNLFQGQFLSEDWHLDFVLSFLVGYLSIPGYAVTF
jgi:hypothetical protein